MILHLDLSTGASGDKLLGALLECCEAQGLITFEQLCATAQKLLPEVALLRTQVLRGSIRATHLEVDECVEGAVSLTHPPAHNKAHEHEQGHKHEDVAGGAREHEGVGDNARKHEHRHGQEHTDESEHQHAHRSWGSIRALIADAAERKVLSEAAAQHATSAFERVALAEGKVHDIAPNEVQFHEVGAADSLIDIVLAGVLFDLLKPTAVYATPLALGNGTVVCAHGELPVPAPATAQIIAAASLPVYASHHQGELTTPTGAALVSEFVSHWAPLPCTRPLALGYGAGSRELAGASNVVRVLAAEPTPLAGLAAGEPEPLAIEGIVRLHCNLDHLSPEAVAFACEELLARGALDVWQEPIVMKKGRSAVMLVVLTQADQAAELARSIHELTGSLGVRSEYVERSILAREVITLETRYGAVPFKAASMDAPLSTERQGWLRPEHDTVAHLAREYAQPYEVVRNALLQDACLRKPSEPFVGYGGK